ncbi:hypothetical protein [Butyrivibrio sp. AE3004]|uniref:hypothetical protein n=1 Tax=Butyrivibrio sp. AE3004 TaxID=1506994 RepID=UPI000493E8EF|nr:hypothetical protein [Butyrivibrio sp. AE3004]
MNINEEKRNQWQALKGMGFKAHWDYFWDYYKVHVIVGIIALATVVSLVRDIASQKPAALSATFVNTASMEEPASIVAGFAEYEGIDTSKYSVSIDASSSINMDNPDQYTIANSEKIYAMIAAHDLDIILADSRIFDNYAKNEMFNDLRDSFSQEELTAFGDSIFCVDPKEYHRNETYPDSSLENQDAADSSVLAETSNDASDITGSLNNTKKVEPVAGMTLAEAEEKGLIPVGIILKDNPHLTAVSYYPGETPIIGLATASERSDTAADFIRYLLK